MSPLAGSCTMLALPGNISSSKMAIITCNSAIFCAQALGCGLEAGDR